MPKCSILTFWQSLRTNTKSEPSIGSPPKSAVSTEARCWTPKHMPYSMREINILSGVKDVQSDIVAFIHGRGIRFMPHQQTW